MDKEKNTELLGIKVKPTTKKLIGETIEQAKAAGMIENQGDMIELLLEHFQHEQLSKKMAYGADIKELNSITRRINEIFIHLAQRNDSVISDMEATHENQLQQKITKIQELKDEIESLNEKLTNKSNEYNKLTETNKVNLSRITELEKMEATYTERIVEQKTIIIERDEKIASINNIIVEKENLITSMKEDINKVNELKRRVVELEEQTENLKLDLKDKEADIQEMADQHQEQLQREKESLEFLCQQQLFKREKELDLEKTNELKELREELTNEVKYYQTRYEAVLNEKDKLNSQNYELKVSLDRDKNNITRLEALLKERDKEIAVLKNEK